MQGGRAQVSEATLQRIPFDVGKATSDPRSEVAHVQHIFGCVCSDHLRRGHQTVTEWPFFAYILRRSVKQRPSSFQSIIHFPYRELAPGEVSNATSPSLDMSRTRIILRHIVHRLTYP